MFTFTKTELKQFNEQILLHDLMKQIEDKFYKSVSKRVLKSLENCNTWEDVQKIKESLRPYPQCPSKVYLFHSIILKEDSLKNR